MFESTLNIELFLGVAGLILVILIFEYRVKFIKSILTSKTIGFIKYLALVIPLKPIFTYLIYPVNKYRKQTTSTYGQFIEQETTTVSDGVQPLGYHIENIFEYEVITFLYALIPILILYLFIEGKNFTSNSRINKLKKLLNQGVLTQEEFDKKLAEIKEEELKEV